MLQQSIALLIREPQIIGFSGFFS